VALIAFLGAACEQPRQVPYIAPQLENWPPKYEGYAGLQLHVFEVGAVPAAGSPFLASAAGEKKLRLFAYVLEHPRQGPVVIDTGLDRRGTREERDRLGGLLGATRHGELNEGQDLPSQMKASGLDPSAVRWVLLSDLRFFNTGQLEAFENARVVVGRNELDAAREGGGDYEQRLFDGVESWRMLDWHAGQPLGTMRVAVDLFDDGSCFAVDVRGATPGTVAFLLRLPSRPVFLAGALAPRPETVRYAAKPTMLHDQDAWWDQIWRLKRFKDLEQRLLVVPSHDATELRGVGGVVWHAGNGRDQRARRSPAAGPPRLLRSR
jgi:glyoxylase-like metal-dependent hydrolase (beta-lactamase superfamily II)